MNAYKIREIGSLKVVGPLSMQELKSLAKEKKITPFTLFYNNTTESWIAIKNNTELSTQIFPNDKSQLLKLKDQPTFPEDISTKFLIKTAQSTDELSTKFEYKAKENALIQPYHLPMLSLLMCASAFYNFFPEGHRIISTFLSNHLFNVLYIPYFLVGCLDTILAISFLLGSSDLYPLLRTRVMIGLGYLGYTFWAFDDSFLLLATIISYLGIFLITRTIHKTTFALCSFASLLGMSILTLSILD